MNHNSSKPNKNRPQRVAENVFLQKRRPPFSTVDRTNPFEAHERRVPPLPRVSSVPAGEEVPARQLLTRPARLLPMSLSCLRTMRPILLALAIVAALLVSTSALPPPSAAKRNAPPQTTAVVHPGHILARLSERLTRFASSLQLPFQNRGARTHTPPSVGVHRKDSTAVAIAAVERPWSAPTFFHDFSRGMDYSRFFFAGLWANGQPFNTGWNPKLGYVDRDGKLALTSKRMDFHDWSATGGGNGKWYKYSSAEIRSWSFYGAGCYRYAVRNFSQFFYFHIFDQF